jgi:hypothetical protein
MDEWAVNSHEELVKKVFDTYGEQRLKQRESSN